MELKFFYSYLCISLVLKNSA